MLICKICSTEKDETCFTRERQTCDECSREKERIYNRNYYKLNAEKKREEKQMWRQTERGTKVDLLAGARRRAKEKNLPFTIEAKDIPPIPEYCPILKNIKLQKGAGGGVRCSPSLDRIDPKLGYVPGNVQVISNRANVLKNDGTLQEFEQLIEWIKTANIF